MFLYSMKFLESIRERMNINTDISSHLDTLYLKALEMNPKRIVELGVRSGESSRMFSYVAQETNCEVFGLDIDTCDYSFVHNGKFFQGDDCKFANYYPIIYGTKNIDILFIDTSHYYDHTVQEIRSWFPHLSDKSLVIFHDTNLGTRYTRKNGTSDQGWDNQRGVVRAVQEYFAFHFDETQDYKGTVVKDGVTWRIEHEAICNGLTLCYKNI